MNADADVAITTMHALAGATKIVKCEGRQPTGVEVMMVTVLRGVQPRG